MFNSVPSLIGISLSPGVLPVRISGPFYGDVSSKSMFPKACCLLQVAGLIPCVGCECVRVVQLTYGIKGNCEWTAGLEAFSFSGVINDRFVVLHRQVKGRLAERTTS